MCKLHKYTVVLTRRDGVHVPRVVHTEAYHVDDAEKLTRQEGYVVAAIFRGHLEAL